MKFIATLLLSCITLFSKAQSLSDRYLLQTPPAVTVPVNNTAGRGINEICGNNIDDDADGLTDMNDYHCYFSNQSATTCTPSKILWGISNEGLFWMNMDDNSRRIIGSPPTEFWGDITWAPNGKLYLSEMNRGEIWEVDPATGATNYLATIPGFNSLNGMTADAQSNLYIAARVVGAWNPTTIIKYNPGTGAVTTVFELASHNLVSGGDMVFMNNMLYVACTGARVAKIDITTGAIQVIPYTGDGTTQSFGLTTFGDGFLYMCLWDKLYQLNLTTGISSFYRQLSPNQFSSLSGTSTYSDQCQSPVCRPAVNIQLYQSPSRCSSDGARLKAVGTGVLGTSNYSWSGPQGYFASADSIEVFTAGWYKVRYHSIPDTCGAVDSVFINFIDPPIIRLPADTNLCPNNSISVSPLSVQNTSTYTWQNGSTATSQQISQPGWYWAQASNGCGTSRDSIQVVAAFPPVVYLGADTLLCPSQTLLLQNQLPRQSFDRYLWSTGASTTTISIQQPGWYWLSSLNSCGTVTDSIFISPKDSCICNPVYATADLGADIELCEGNTVQLKPLEPLPQNHFNWSDGSSNPVMQVNAPGIYWVQVSTYCNTASDTIVVTKKEDCSCETYLPSVFTPNNDGTNDLFKPLCNCEISGTFAVFNRYGEQVFYTRDLLRGWDGSYKNVPQPIGTYVYQLQYIVTGRPTVVRKNGTVTLLR